MAQPPALQGELNLDARTGHRADFPYQHWDTLHTTELRGSALFASQTRAHLLVQRKYDATRLVEAHVERPLSPHVGLKLGLQRLPFGIYEFQETYRSGLIDYALPRVDYGDTGVDQSVLGLGGTLTQGPLQAEGALFQGEGVTSWNGEDPFRGVAGRLQLFLPPNTLVGLSHCSESQRRYPSGRQQARLTGLDLRYTRPFLVLRGETIFGTLERQRYAGAYLDAFYRLPGLPAWTLTARTEELKPTPTSGTAHQLTVGARWTIDPQWTATLNWRRNDIGTKYPGTWIPQSGKHGDLLFQLYRTVPLGS